MAVESNRFEPYGLTRAFHLGLRALGRRYSQREVAARLGGHPQSGSLLAIADLASSFGVEVTACLCDLDDIGPEGVPVLLQLQSGGRSGFAIVVEVAEDAFGVIDSRGVRRRVSRPELQQMATGVSVFLESSPESGQPERAYLLNRLLDLSGDLGERLSWRFPRFAGASGGMRLVSLVLMAASVILALMSSPDLRIGLLATSLVAVVAASAWLSWLLFSIGRSGEAIRHSPLSRRLCAPGRGLDCDSVLHSRWAGIGPWPLSSLGLAWCLSLLAAFGCVGVLAPRTGALWLACSLLLVAPVSLFLTLVQVWPLKKLCPLCMAVHLALLSGAAVSWRLLAPGIPRMPDHLTALWPAALLQVWLFSLVLGVLMPWIKDSGDLAHLSSELASVTSTPLGSLALVLASPALAVPAGSDLLGWGNPQAPLRVDGFVNPTCPSCGPVLSELLDLAQKHGDRIRVVIHLVEKDGAHPLSDRALLLAVMAVASLRGRDTAAEAFWTIKDNPEQWLREAAAGAWEMGARLSGCGREEIDQVLPMAREELERASVLTRLARSGLPFVLLAGRRFSASVRHLEALVDSHYELLLESLGIETGEARLTFHPAPRE